jgi:predicted dehydrogenase
MADNPVLRLLGRRLRLGVIGGGGNALIGPVHRIAARLDDRFDIVAAVLSSDPDRALAEAAANGIARGYRDVPAMLAAEKQRADGIDAVAIATPNDSHAAYAGMTLAAGLDVICDKPLTNDLASARDLVAAVRRAGAVFCLTHNYSGYPMVREARAAIAAGEIGPVRVVHVTYIQGSLGARVEDNRDTMPARLKWRLDPAKGGVSHVMADIGVHAHQLLTYVTGEHVAAVLADVGAALPGRAAHDTGAALLRLRNGARGVLFATKAATGAENAIAIEAYGEAGGVYWEQANPNVLRVMRNARPAELRSRGLPTLHPLSRRSSRIPPGHPEAFFEAFANLYADFAELAAARRAGAAPDPLATHLPTVEDGAHGLAFIDACLASTARGGWVDCPGID